MSQYVNEEGIPLRGDGTPFPQDQSQWSDEERTYLQQYQFGVNKDWAIGQQEVATADVPEISGDQGGSAIA